jgi:GH18 family chitinase
MPLGVVAKTILPVGSQSPIDTTETDVAIGATALAATFTAVTGKTYKVTAYLNVVTAGSTSADLRIKVGSTVYGRSVNYVRPASGANTYGTTIGCETIISELTAGSTTIKASLQATDALATLAPTVTTLLDRSFILVEDLGTL